MTCIHPKKGTYKESPINNSILKMLLVSPYQTLNVIHSCPLHLFKKS